LPYGKKSGNWAAVIGTAEEMLMFPVIAHESEDGKTIIMPTSWKVRDIPRNPYNG